MKYDYKFEEFELSNKKKRLAIKLPREIELVATFLAYDIQSNPIFAIEVINKVLNSQSDYEEWTGNICGLEIRKDKTVVLDNLSDNGKGNWCEIETNELRELIDIWVSTLKKFNNK